MPKRGAELAEHSAASNEKRGIRPGRRATVDPIAARHTARHVLVCSLFPEMDREADRKIDNNGSAVEERRERT